MQWEIVIGLEVHAQLSTHSKIFSGASTAYGAPPNTQACVIDLALPGVLPVLNKGAVERAIKFGLAVGAKINSPSIFARKNYFYPDLPKGYQISQYELPVVQGGSIVIQADGVDKSIRLTGRTWKDAGKSLHEDFHGMSGIDLNRAGTPLLEIVSNRTCVQHRSSGLRQNAAHWCAGSVFATATCRKARFAATPMFRLPTRLTNRHTLRNQI